MTFMKTGFLLAICLVFSNSLDNGENSGLFKNKRSSSYFNIFGINTKETTVEDKCRMKCNQNGIKYLNVFKN